MRLGIILGIFLCFSTHLTSQEEENAKKDIETEKMTLWEAEINAIYKEKGKVRAIVPVDPVWTGRNFEEIRERIQKIKEFPIRQKITKKKIGTFEVREVEHERSIEKGKKVVEYQIMIYGKLKLRKKSYFKNASSSKFL